jgi:hypothetical protein
MRARRQQTRVRASPGRRTLVREIGLDGNIANWLVGLAPTPRAQRPPRCLIAATYHALI